MIITKEVKIKISPSNIDYYINKIGYEPKVYIDKEGKKRNKSEIISVNIKDVSPGCRSIVEVVCDNCGKIHNKSYRDAIKNSNFCNKKCMQEYRTNQFLKEFESEIGEDAKTFLEREYIQNKKSFRNISIEIFGHDGYRNSLSNWCKKLGIQVRKGSEAVETQWINNTERRKQNAELMRKVMGIEEVKKNHTIPELRKTSAYQEWRLKVYARDSFTCVKCGKPRDYKTKLNAHHLESFMYNEELRYNIDNGVTLCQSCHMKFHSKYSNRNNTKEQFEEFLKTK